MNIMNYGLLTENILKRCLLDFIQIGSVPTQMLGTRVSFYLFHRKSF